MLVTTFGTSDASAAEGRRKRGVRPSAATVTVQTSFARVSAQAFDGLGTVNEISKPASDFILFDKTASRDDTDDAPRGAAGTFRQVTTIAETGTELVIDSNGDGNARLYDRNLGDALEPRGSGQSVLTVSIDIAGGMAAWSLRGSMEADSDADNIDCASVIVTAPDGSDHFANGDCSQSLDSADLDLSGTLGAGNHLFEVEAIAGVLTDSGSPVRASAAYDLRLVVAACTVLGTSADDASLDGTNGDDVICGLEGSDEIAGFSGNDTIFGGAGGDVIAAGPGTDVVFGQGGDDSIQGGSGDDTVFGGPGDDTISDLRGPNRRLSGDGGSDVICGSHQRDVIDGGPDFDAVLGLGGRDRVDGDAGGDSLKGDGTAANAIARGCEAPSGSASGPSNDVIDGGIGDDVIAGGGGGDILRGGFGSDSIDGDGGADTIVGGPGANDILRGGAANDIMNACDGARDRVFGGPGGNDRVRRTAGLDIVNADVEVRRNC